MAHLHRLCVPVIAPAILLWATTGCGRISSSLDGTFQQPKETADEVVKQTYQTGAKPTLVVDTLSGNVTFEAGDASSVQIEVLKQGWGETKEEAQANLKKIELTLEQKEDTIRIIAKGPDSAAHGKPIVVTNAEDLKKLHGVGKADVKIRAPAQAMLDFKTGRGDITATGATNRFKAHSGSGGIAARQNAAAFDLISGYGSITTDGPGSGKAKSSSGSIEVRGCKEPVVLETGYGAIKVANANGITATTSSGDIAIGASNGPMQVKSGYGRIEIKNANGSTRAETSSGPIQIAGDKGDYAAKSGYGNISLNVKDSAVQAETNSGSIDVQGATGNVKAHSGYGNLNVHGDNAVVDLRSNSGSATFGGSLTAGESRIASGYGNVTVSLPADASFKLHAKTGYGAIHSQFAVTKTKGSEKEWVGTVGTDPRASLLIESTSGSVNINKR